MSLKPTVFVFSLAIVLFGCGDDGPQNPIITKVTPTQGYEGDQITIEGKNFSSLSNENSVKINGVDAVVASSSSASIIFFVPVNATSGKIEVTSKSFTVTSAENFTIITGTTPHITNINLPNGKTGSTVELTGDHFTSDLNAISVLFTNASNEPAEIVSATTTSIKAKVPDNALSGPVTLSVRGVTALETPQFDVYEKVTDYSPKTGTVGDFITFNGTGFTTSTKLHFVGDVGEPILVEPKIYSLTNKKIIAIVPNNVGSGNLRIGIFNESIPVSFTFRSSWTAKSKFPINRLSNVSFATNDKAYFGFAGGFKDLWEYDPQNDTWIQKSDFPGSATSGWFSASLGNKGYIGLGKSSTPSDEIWEYDPTQDKWSLVSHFPGTLRTYPASFVIDGSIFIVSGAENDLFNGQLKESWKYTPSNNTWVKIADFPDDGGASYGAMTINGKGYVGRFGKPSVTSINFFYEYNPVTNTWTKKKNIPVPSQVFGTDLYTGMPTFTTSSEGFVFYNNTYYKYIVSLDEWVILRAFELSVDLSCHITLNCGSTVNGKGYFFDFRSDKRVVVFSPN